MRGRGSRGYRGSRGNSWNGNSRGGYPGSGRYSSMLDSRSPYDSRSKYSSSERYSRSDDYHKSYRSDYSSLGRDRRSPEHKRLRLDAPSSRHDSYYGSSSRHDPYSERRGLSSERHSSLSRREEFRRPSGPPRRGSGSYRGRLSSRGSRSLRARDRLSRHLLDSSYAIRRRPRISEYTRRPKISRLRRRGGGRRGIRERDSDDEKEMETEVKEDGENEEVKVKVDGEDGKEEKSEGEEKKRSSKAFIKLQCPHCNMKAATFRRYEIHLRSRSHLIAMRRVALKQKAILNQMRKAQRNTQNELEKSVEDLSTKTSYCPLCKLNYKQKRATHQLSESHKNMKKFLMPFCKVCNIAFKSPMIYESHCCTIEHIKRKQRMEGSDVSAEEDNLENFTTIDSVGDVEESSEMDDKKDGDKEVVNMGIEKIRKIEAYYCDLCKMYLTRGEESETPQILARHCKQRVHTQRYLRLKEIETLEKRAEKLQRKELASKEVKDEKAATDKEKKDEEEAKDDKLWADVDKDLGDILAEAESGNKSSDEDEDSHVNGERYDRFKLSEKNEDEKLMATDEEGILDNKLIINDAVEEKK